jgi:hypothetical protein
MSPRRERLTRRHFVQRAGSAAALATFVPGRVLGAEGQPAANDRLGIAGIGVGGRGDASLRGLASENIIGLCDVDTNRASKAFKDHPKAKQYRDFRKMLDELDADLDAVFVATPDHTHAVATMSAMTRGKHVYCEKPFAHSIYEIRQLMQAARDNKVITQLGNQGHSSNSIRTFCEWIWDGAIGNVTEVHAACDAFPDVYCQINILTLLAEKQTAVAGRETRSAARVRLGFVVGACGIPSLPSGVRPLELARLDAFWHRGYRRLGVSCR